MWMTLVLLVLFLVVALRAGTQGFFSSFIMAVLTICCVAAAFGTYEWVGTRWVEPIWPLNRDYILPVSLGAIFGVPLLLLRLLFDYAIRRAPLVPGWLDRFGGGFCGLLTAAIMVGTLAICLEMLPFFGGAVLGHSRIAITSSQTLVNPEQTPPDPNASENELLLTPDRFMAGLAVVLVDGVFDGNESFAQHNPDLVQTVGWVGATHNEVSRYAPPKSVTVVETRLIDSVYTITPPTDLRSDDPPTYDAEPPKGGHELRMVQIRLSGDARDANTSHNFTLRQVRLVGHKRGEESLVQYHAVAIQEAYEDVPTNRYIRHLRRGGQLWPVIDDVYSPISPQGEVEVVFELPTGFKPTFLEYKRQARCTVSFDSKRTSRRDRAETRAPDSKPDSTASATAAKTPTTAADGSASAGETPAARPPATDRRASARRNRRNRRNQRNADTSRGARSRAVASAGDSHFGDDLPVTMRSYRREKDVEISGNKMVSGHLIGDLDQQESGGDKEVSKFEVPEDKRLLHLSSVRLKARSTLGRALSQAVVTVQNYFVQAKNGQQYTIVGKYAIANVRGKQVVEIQYFSNRSGSIGGFDKFSQIDESKLGPNDQFVLLFLVDPGARIVAFSTGGSSTRRDDLTDQNIVAPQ